MLWGRVNSYSPSFLSPWSCLSCNEKPHNKKVKKKNKHLSSREFLVIGKAFGSVVGVGKISGRGSSVLCAVATTFALKWTHTIQNCLTHWQIGWMVTGCEDLTEIHLIYWAPPCNLESLSDSEALSVWVVLAHLFLFSWPRRVVSMHTLWNTSLSIISWVSHKCQTLG